MDFSNIYYKGRSECVVCGNEIVPTIELPNLPLTDVYLPAPIEIGKLPPQSLGVCPECGHAQLLCIIQPDILYSEHNYSFRTSKSLSTGANDRFYNFLKKVTPNKFDTILEIGCNDCYLLNTLRDKADKLIGIDPILAGHEHEYNDDKLTVIGESVEDVLLLGGYGNTLVLSSHVMEHLDNPRTVIEKLLEVVGDDAVFIFQFPSFDYLVEDSRFDQVYNHHLHYFSLYSFWKLIKSLGCGIIDYTYDSSYWGTLVVAFKKNSDELDFFTDKITVGEVKYRYSAFKDRMSLVTYYILGVQNKYRMYCYGASLQFPVLAYHLKYVLDNFECIVDDDPNKDNMYYPNISLQVKSIDKNLLEGSVVLITAPNFSRDIINKISPFNPMRIIIPVGGI